jgi:hypothetical protein
MIGNLFFTAFYLFVGLFLGFLAWSNYFPGWTWVIWLGAGAFLLIAAWRVLHLSQQGPY